VWFEVEESAIFGNRRVYAQHHKNRTKVGGSEGGGGTDEASPGPETNPREYKEKMGSIVTERGRDNARPLFNCECMNMGGSIISP